MRTACGFLESAQRYRDFPDYPNGLMAAGMLDQVRAFRSRVLLSGLGGDEWFDFGRGTLRRRVVSSLPRCIRYPLSPLAVCCGRMLVSNLLQTGFIPGSTKRFAQLRTFTMAVVRRIRCRLG